MEIPEDKKVSDGAKAQISRFCGNLGMLASGQIEVEESETQILTPETLNIKFDKVWGIASDKGMILPIAPQHVASGIFALSSILCPIPIRIEYENHEDKLRFTIKWGFAFWRSKNVKSTKDISEFMLKNNPRMVNLLDSLSNEKSRHYKFIVRCMNRTRNRDFRTDVFPKSLGDEMPHEQAYYANLRTLVYYFCSGHLHSENQLNDIRIRAMDVIQFITDELFDKLELVQYSTVELYNKNQSILIHELVSSLLRTQELLINKFYNMNFSMLDLGRMAYVFYNRSQYEQKLTNDLKTEIINRICGAHPIFPITKYSETKFSYCKSAPNCYFAGQYITEEIFVGHFKTRYSCYTLMRLETEATGNSFYDLPDFKNWREENQIVEFTLIDFESYLMWQGDYYKNESYRSESNRLEHAYISKQLMKKLVLNCCMRLKVKQYMDGTAELCARHKHYPSIASCYSKCLPPVLEKREETVFCAITDVAGLLSTINPDEGARMVTSQYIGDDEQKMVLWTNSDKGVKVPYTLNCVVPPRMWHGYFSECWFTDTEVYNYEHYTGWFFRHMDEMQREFNIYFTEPVCLMNPTRQSEPPHLIICNDIPLPARSSLWLDDFNGAECIFWNSAATYIYQFIKHMAGRKDITLFTHSMSAFMLGTGGWIKSLHIRKHYTDLKVRRIKQIYYLTRLLAYEMTMHENIFNAGVWTEHSKEHNMKLMKKYPNYKPRMHITHNSVITNLDAMVSEAMNFTLYKCIEKFDDFDERPIVANWLQLDRIYEKQVRRVDFMLDLGYKRHLITYKTKHGGDISGQVKVGR